MVIYCLIIPYQIQLAGETVKPVGNGVLIERRDAQGLQVASAFADILRRNHNTVGHDA